MTKYYRMFTHSSKSCKGVTDMPDITIALTTLISVVSVSAAVFFGVKSKKRADDSEVEARTEKLTRLEEKIDALSNNFEKFAEEIKKEIRDMRKNYDDIKTEQVKLQTEMKHILQRLDKLEGA